MSDPTSRTTPEALRGHADDLDSSARYWVCGVLRDAADEIERLLADNRNMEAARDTIERLTKDNGHMAERAQADFVALKELRAKLEGLHQGDL